VPKEQILLRFMLWFAGSRKEVSPLSLSMNKLMYRMKIKRLPNVLALHLKRFKYQENLGRYTKLFYRVPFPTQLKLPNTSDDVENPDRLYELFAVVVHIGKYVIVRSILDPS
jgi:ubiquitin C-terminal hydrolase